jgi:amino acid permease
MTRSGAAPLTARRPTLATFGIMVVAIVGGGVLALPTALSRFGVLPAGGIIFVLGLVNVLTLAALAGAVARSTATSSGRGVQGVLTDDHLGRMSSLSSTITSVLLWFGIFSAYLLGSATSLANLVGGQAWMWATASFLLITPIIYKRSRRLLIAGAVIVAVSTLVVFAVMMVILAFQVDAGIITAPAPPDPGDGVHPLELVFGTALVAYFGHTSIFGVAPEVLRADPSGRSLRRGAVAAMFAGTAVNVGWVVVCLAAVGPSRFIGESGTGVALLVEVGGPAIRVLSTLFVLLAMGVSAVNAAFILEGLIAERLPNLRQVSTVLGPGASVLAQDPVSLGSVTITALRVPDGSLQLVARATHGRRAARRIITDDAVDLTPLLREVGVDRKRAWVRVTVMGETGPGIAVRVDSSLPITERTTSARPESVFVDDGLEAQIVRSVVRAPQSADEVADDMATDMFNSAGIARADVLTAIDTLVTADRLRTRPDGRLHAVLGQRHRAKTALVTGLLDELVGSDEVRQRPDDVGVFGADSVRRAVGAAPCVLGYVAVLLMLWSGVNFASLLSVMSIATIVFLGGAIPLLLALSLRRRAERVVARQRFLPPSVLWIALVGFMAICLLYAILLFRTIPERLVAAAALVLIVASVVSAKRNGAFQPRSTVLVELDAEGTCRVTALHGGVEQPLRAPSQVPDDATELRVEIPEGLPSPVLVLTIDGETLPARLGSFTVRSAPDVDPIELRVEDLAGTLVETPDAPVEFAWSLR